MAKRRPIPKPPPTRLSLPPVPHLTVRNLLLASLPTLDRDRLLPTFAVVPLKLRDVVHRAGEPVHHVYFPGGGFLSVVTVLRNGRMGEVATIGREGMVGGAAAGPGIRVGSATMVDVEADLLFGRHDV